MDLTEAKVLR